MNSTVIFILSFLDLFSEVIHLVFQVGALSRKYLVPVVVYVYCLIRQYIVPAMSIPYYYWQVRQQRLAMA